MENNIGIGADAQHLYVGRRPAYKFTRDGIQPQKGFGGISAQEGQTISPRLVRTGGVIPATPFSDALLVDDVHYCEVFVPANMRVTGVNVLYGDVVDTTLVSVGIYDSTGAIVAYSNPVVATTEGAVDSYGVIPFTAPVHLSGPGTYYIAVYGDDSGATEIATHTAGDGFAAGNLDLVGGVFSGSKLTIDGTFTADKGPVATLY